MSFSRTVLVPVLCFSALAAAQTAPPQQTPPEPQTQVDPLPEPPIPSPGEAAPPEDSRDLRIYVLQGDRVINSIANRVAVSPVVEVRDRQQRPIAGVEVVFEMPAAGPGAYFLPGRQLTFTTRTNRQGQAGGAPVMPNNEPGRFKIKVSAKSGERVAIAEITQTNAAKGEAVEVAPRPKRRTWIYAVAAGAGGGAAAFFLLRNRTETLPTITLSPGAIVIGGPR